MKISPAITKKTITMKPIFIDRSKIVSLLSQELNPSSFGHCQCVRAVDMVHWLHYN